MATNSLVLHINVNDEGTWNLQVVDMTAPFGPGKPLAEHVGHGFGPDEAELGAALDRLDKVLDPTGTDLTLQCWWADAWAASLERGGLGNDGIARDIDEAA